MNTMECRACGMESDACDKCPVCGAVGAVIVKRFESPAMDALTSEFTAFADFNELAEAMRGGYVPTISLTRVGIRTHARKAQFVEAVRACGFKVFDGRRVA